MATTRARSRGQLLFIDTNILLDFYRSRNDAGLSLLGKIEPLHAHIITSSQVEMEFKKNRQKVILESLNALKAPEGVLTPAAFLAEAKHVEVAKRHAADIKKRIDKLKDRLRRVLDRPAVHDPVYKVTQRLFGNDSDYNLKRGHTAHPGVRRKAWRRFILGYPPRKKEDNSIGDAINWEWMVDCIFRANKDLVIVSRDADYGISYGTTAYANDWLVQELKQRTNQQRRITLHTKLADALRTFHVPLTPEEAKVEEETRVATPSEGPEDRIFRFGRVLTNIDDAIRSAPLFDRERWINVESDAQGL